MRVAILVISLILMFVVFMQSCAIAVAGSIAKNETMSGSGAIGIMVALLFMLGAAFAMGKPTVSLALFVLAAFFAFLGGASTDFHDLTLWGIVSLALAVMSYFGRRERRQPKVAGPGAETSGTE